MAIIVKIDYFFDQKWIQHWKFLGENFLFPYFRRSETLLQAKIQLVAKSSIC